VVNLFVPYPTLTFAALFLAEELGFFRKLNPRVQLQLGGIDRQIDVLLGGEPGIVPLMLACVPGVVEAGRGSSAQFSIKLYIALWQSLRSEALVICADVLSWLTLSRARLI